MTEKIELTREQLTKILQVATGNVKDFVMNNDKFIDEQLEVINYKPCCTQLKVKETPSFEDWLITMQIQKKGRLYFAKDGIEQDINALHRRYVQTLQEQYF